VAFTGNQERESCGMCQLVGVRVRHVLEYMYNSCREGLAETGTSKGWYD